MDININTAINTIRERHIEDWVSWSDDEIRRRSYIRTGYITSRYREPYDEREYFRSKEYMALERLINKHYTTKYQKYLPQEDIPDMEMKEVLI